MCTLRKGDKEMTLETLKNRVLECHGTLQHQKVTSYAYLNFDSYDSQDVLPFSEGGIYKIGYLVDDHKECVWCVACILDVTGSASQDLPEVFRAWDLGRRAAGVAPFDA